MNKRKSQSFYLGGLRSYVEQAYYLEKKDQRSPSWSPFVSKTSFSLEKKVEAELREEMNKNMDIREQDEAFREKEHHV